MQVFSKDGDATTLGEKLAAGGEGTVYPLVQRPEILVKVYHPDVLKKHSNMLKPKIEAMISTQGEVSDRLSWPLLSAFNDRGDWIGYAMRRQGGVSMFVLAHAMLYQKHFPGLDRARIAGYLLDYLRTLEALHRRNIMVGDFNLRNILCDPGSSRVSLIDSDSYQFMHMGNMFPCPVLSPDMSPPEHHTTQTSSLPRTLESERFSAAIVLFKALMLGRHPYDVVGGESPVQNIQRGYFPYGVGGGGIPKGDWYNIWSHMPYRLKNLFIQAFGEGARNPSARPGLEQWINELRTYQHEITEKGWHESAIRPKQAKARAYRGSRSIESATNVD